MSSKAGSTCSPYAYVIYGTGERADEEGYLHEQEVYALRQKKKAQRPAQQKPGGLRAAKDQLAQTSEDLNQPNPLDVRSAESDERKGNRKV